MKSGLAEPRRGAVDDTGDAVAGNGLHVAGLGDAGGGGEDGGGEGVLAAGFQGGGG